MLYPCNNVNKIINRNAWDTQKSIEAEENRALKKEEQKEKIRKSNLPCSRFTKRSLLVYGYL